MVSGFYHGGVLCVSVAGAGCGARCRRARGRAAGSGTAPYFNQFKYGLPVMPTGASMVDVMMGFGRVVGSAVVTLAWGLALTSAGGVGPASPHTAETNRAEPNTAETTRAEPNADRTRPSPGSTLARRAPRGGPARGRRARPAGRARAARRAGADGPSGIRGEPLRVSGRNTRRGGRRRGAGARGPASARRRPRTAQRSCHAPARDAARACTSRSRRSTTCEGFATRFRGSAVENEASLLEVVLHARTGDSAGRRPARADPQGGARGAQAEQRLFAVARESGPRVRVRASARGGSCARGATTRRRRRPRTCPRPASPASRPSEAWTLAPALVASRASCRPCSQLERVAASVASAPRRTRSSCSRGPRSRPATRASPPGAGRRSRRCPGGRASARAFQLARGWRCRAGRPTRRSSACARSASRRAQEHASGQAVGQARAHPERRARPRHRARSLGEPGRGASAPLPRSRSRHGNRRRRGGARAWATPRVRSATSSGAAAAGASGARPRLLARRRARARRPPRGGGPLELRKPARGRDLLARLVARPPRAASGGGGEAAKPRLEPRARRSRSGDAESARRLAERGARGRAPAVPPSATRWRCSRGLPRAAGLPRRPSRSRSTRPRARADGGAGSPGGRAGRGGDGARGKGEGRRARPTVDHAAAGGRPPLPRSRRRGLGGAPRRRACAGSARPTPSPSSRAAAATPGRRCALRRAAGDVGCPPTFERALPPGRSRCGCSIPTRTRSIVDVVARARGLDPDLVRSVMREESRFDPEALSPAGRARAHAVHSRDRAPSGRSHRDAGRDRAADVQQPEVAIPLGAAYLAELLRTFGGQRGRGGRRLQRRRGGGRSRGSRGRAGGALDEFLREIEFAETRTYVDRVLTSLAAYRGARTRDPPPSASLAGLTASALRLAGRRTRRYNPRQAAFRPRTHS